MEGNARFVSQQSIDVNEGADRRVAVSKGQKPFAGIIGCVDSRVAPELVFDRGLGDLFTSRVAGAIADDSAIGSVEFGVLEFKIPLLIVLGHSNCGAVKATIEAVETNNFRAPGQIGAIVSHIVPAVRAAIADGCHGPELVAQSIVGTVRATVAALTSSEVLAPLITTGHLKVVGATYDLGTGVVTHLA